MRRIILVFVMVMLSFTTACSKNGTPMGQQHVAIDWIDFIKINGKEYNAVYEAMLSRDSFVTDKVVGEVKFKVGDVVSDPGYKIKDGDAAYLPIGTKAYAIKGYSENEMLTVKVYNVINGYKVYVETKSREKHKFDFEHLPQDQIISIEIIKEDNIISQLENKQKKEFLALLNGGITMQSFSANQSQGQPDTYQMVFYTGGVLAYKYYLYDDHKAIYFNPDQTRVINSDVKMYLSALSR